MTNSTTSTFSTETIFQHVANAFAEVTFNAVRKVNAYLTATEYGPIEEQELRSALLTDPAGWYDTFEDYLSWAAEDENHELVKLAREAYDEIENLYALSEAFPA